MVCAYLVLSPPKLQQLALDFVEGPRVCLTWLNILGARWVGICQSPFGWHPFVLPYELHRSA